MKVFIVLSILVCLSNARSLFKEVRDSCGYDACHPIRSDILNVHIVPHTHDDVGWLKTVDQYYFGSRTLIQKAGVQYIIDSVIDELLKDPVRRFVYVESSFFERWWLEQNENRRDQVRQLVSEGRLEFAGGAWSMNDEAATHYHSVLDQLTWGLRFLNDTFGKCGRPLSGWQIDPFGHSRELASMWAQAGFDGLLLGRIDYQDKRRRLAEQEAEMVWRGSDDLGEESDILSGYMYNTYSPPPGFCFDILCADEPFIDDVNSPDYNVDAMLTKFVSYVSNAAKGYKSNNLIITMGGDFTYQDALVWYKNLDKLIKYVNERYTNMTLLYSTPGCYIKALHESNTDWPREQNDFFPYASDPHTFWTGYFTSRPNSKYYERKGNNFLQVCKQLFAMTKLNDPDQSNLYKLRSAMGIMQHHDAVTGTEKQHVADDYHRIVEAGFQDCLKTVNEAINELSGPSSNLQIKLCQLNQTQCDVTENSDAFVVTAYNPLAQTVSKYIRIPVIGEGFSVKDSTGAVVETQIIEVSQTLVAQLKNRKSNATHEIIFRAEDIPAMGYNSYYIQKDSSIKNKIKEKIEKIRSSARAPSQKEDIDAIENENIRISIDSDTGLISKISILQNGEWMDTVVKQELVYYEGMLGNNMVFENRSSGAYIFRPNGTANSVTDKVTFSFVKGSQVEELHQYFNDWISQVVRLYKGENHVEFEWLVGPIPDNDGIGKEVISRFSTDIKSDATFFTDSNGRQLLTRIRDTRPTWEIELNETISGNYYPVTSMISIRDTASKKELYVLNDRAQGGSSLKDGEVELMVHRRLLHDDAFGVEEALNETIDGIGIVARGSHYLVLGNSDQATNPLVYSRELALKVLLEPTILVAPADGLTLTQWLSNNNKYAGVVSGLPKNIHLLTYEPWKDGTVLLRLEHYLQTADDPDNLSKPVTIDLEQILADLTVKSVRETTLAANQWKDEAKKLKWRSNEKTTFLNTIYKVKHLLGRKTTSECAIERDVKAPMVTLAPMEIKTFVIELE